MTATLMPEKDLLQAVRDIARLRGWLTFHTHRSTHSEPGFPDLLMIKGDRLLVVELKADAGRLSIAQERWLTALRGHGHVEVFIWRPEDLRSGEIAATLTDRAA